MHSTPQDAPPSPSHNPIPIECQASSESIEDGSYFEEARLWYNLRYIGPISERIFFIIITTFALAICAMSIMSLYNLLPISPRIPFVYNAKDMFAHHPNMIRFKEPNEPANPALIKYYLGTYVRMRENYDERRYLMYRAFTKNYSDNRTFREYDRLTNPNNPRSPIRQYGKYADLNVTIDSTTFNRETAPYQGTVEFTTEVLGTEQTKKAHWTAVIRFEYKDLIETEHFDEELGDYVLHYEEPAFRVLNYDVRERLLLQEKR